MEKNARILITGGAGFIGFHLSRSLLEQGYEVAAIDSINDYYDTSLKEARLTILKRQPKYTFIHGSLEDEALVNETFSKYQPDYVVNLAAQPGVRYSIENPRAYINSNIIGFFNILEACRHYPVKHLLFASSSSVYGMQKKTPYSESDPVDHPISLYAATKKSDELMAYCYCHLYHIPSTGLRFFTVYGPFGRPDMAYFSFTNKIIKGEPIKIFNHGDLQRDFTYIDDIVHGIEDILPCPPKANESGDLFKVYNIGNNHPVRLMDFINTLEKAIGREAKKEYLPMQPGDVYQTYADVTELQRDFGFKPSTSIEEGLQRFADWYMEYYQIEKQAVEELK